MSEKFLVPKEPSGVSFLTPHRVYVPKCVRRVWGIKPKQTSGTYEGPYLSNRPGPKLRKWLHAFPDRLECGCVRAKSAIDLPMLASTGVKRIEWMSPAWGPVTTVAIPEICPRSLILLALIMRRLESSGISVLRSVSTWFCQIKPPDQLKPESKVLPTTCPLLLMPVALEAFSPGRMPRTVSVPSGCQREATRVEPSAVRT